MTIGTLTNGQSVGAATPQNVRDTARRNTQGSRRGNFRGKTRNILPGIEKLTVKDVTEAVSAVLGEIPAKDIVEATGGSERAAENVREGLNAPSLTNFINLCRACPALRARALELLGCKAEVDPEFVLGVNLLIGEWVRKNGQTTSA